MFLALTLVLVLSFIFSLLEGARVYCFQSRARIVSEQCMQSMFGNYQKGLWEDYHLLFLDGGWQDGEFSMDKFVWRAMEEVTGNLTYRGEHYGEKGWDLTSLTPVSISADRYQLATDDKGQVFQSQVAIMMQLEAASDALDELLRLKDQGHDVEEREKQKEDNWEQAWDAMDEAEEIKKEQEEAAREEGYAKDGAAEGQGESDETKTQQEGAEGAEELENPMDYVKELKSSTMLGMVVSDPSQISGKALERGDFLEDRKLIEGNWQEEGAGIMDRLWLHYYIQNYFSDYTRDSEKGPAEKRLDYEMEYLLSGRKSDSQNLENVVYRLLGIREVMNFVTIMQDAGKKSLALSIATAVVGFTGIVPLVKAVQIGILLAWAFVESVLDVRTLLEGKKIPLIKRTDQWASDLTDCRKTVESGTKADEDGEGLTYTQYLQMMLFLLSQETLNYRCMDLMERNLNIRMDHMVQAVESEFFYEAEPLFWNLNVLAIDGWESFHLSVPSTMTYGGGR